MSKLEQFLGYAAAFEKAFESDDWSILEPFFAEDAVYEVNLEPPRGGRFAGRTAILAYFKDIVDRFDRCFESRELKFLGGMKQDGDSVSFCGGATYGSPGVPDLVLVLEETVDFDGDHIRRLDDHYDAAMKEEADAYLLKYGEKLGISFED